MFSEDQKAALNAPLVRTHVCTRTQAGRTLSYLEGWFAIAEANRIFGFDGWTRETIRLEETNRDLLTLKGERGEYQQWRVGYLAIVKVTAFAGDAIITRHGTGFGSGMAKPEALSDAIESAAKEAETDAMKRALMTFGNPFGLALYDKTQSSVVSEEAPANGRGKRTMQEISANKERKAATLDSIYQDIAQLGSLRELERWERDEDVARIMATLPLAHQAHASERLEERRKELSPPEATAEERLHYMSECKAAIEEAKTRQQLAAWWTGHSGRRRELGLSQSQVDELRDAVEAKRDSLPAGRDAKPYGTGLRDKGGNELTPLDAG